MIVNEEILKTQESLSKVNIDFLEFVEKNPNTLKRSSFKLLELNDHLFTLQPWPTFINKKTRETFKDASLKLWTLIQGIPKRVFNNDPDKISKYFEIPVKVIELQLEGITDDHIKNLVARGDFIFSPTGLKCLEYNVSVNLGGLQVPIWESLYLNTPILSPFFKKLQLKTYNENLFSLLLEQIIWAPLKNAREGDEINTAVAMEAYVVGDQDNSFKTYLNQLYKKILQSKNKSLTGEVILCDYQHLRIEDNYVFFKEKKIQALAEMYHGLVPPRILAVFKAGNISLTNGPITNLLSNKLMLAVLSDYETFDVFTDEEIKIIDSYLPWTRKIKPGPTTYGKQRIENLEDFMLSNKDKLVIKPYGALGGEGISVGSKCTETQWKEAVKNAMNKKNWLVQDRVEYRGGLYQSGETGCAQHDMVWGFFVFGSTYAGAWVRVMPRDNNRGIINCHQGATVSVIFEVDE
jgi:hypothetical protein